MTSLWVPISAASIFEPTSGGDFLAPISVSYSQQNTCSLLTLSSWFDDLTYAAKVKCHYYYILALGTDGTAKPGARPQLRIGCDLRQSDT